MKYQALRSQFFSMGGMGGGWGVVVGVVITLSFQSNSNSQKLSLWSIKNHCRRNEGLKI